MKIADKLPHLTEPHVQIYRESTQRIYKNEPCLTQTGEPTPIIQLFPPHPMHHSPIHIQLIRQAFKEVEEKHIDSFSLVLFPCSYNKERCENLYLALLNFYQIKKCPPLTLQEVKEAILAKGGEFGFGVPQALDRLYGSEQFCRHLEASVKKYFDYQKPEIIQITQKDNSPTSQGTGKLTISKKGGGSLKSNSIRPQSKKYGLSNIPGDLDQVANLADRGICLCEKEVMSVQDSFVCVHCGYAYHLECMKRKEKVKHCALCHLKKLLPNKQTKKTLFMGVLRKGKKRHEFPIYLTEQDLSMRYKLQVRCFRLKQTTQNFLLFPDHAEIFINSLSLKEYHPLHRQSSLKYRKDEPFFAELKHLLPKQNKVCITEKLPSKELKDVRIEVQNHLIGLFMIEQRRVDALIKEVSISSISAFEESKKILDSAFIQSSGLDGVSCEVVKIPLTCTLTTEKIKLPARGLFCCHYQCFDLYNYMMMTSQSVNPRWVCPLCKLPSYAFRIDCILLAILEEYSQHALSEVMFFKTGDFSVYAGENLVKEKICNIMELPIESIAKRAAVQMPEPEKRKRRPNSIPEASKVISLDLD